MRERLERLERIPVTRYQPADAKAISHTNLAAAFDGLGAFEDSLNACAKACTIETLPAVFIQSISAYEQLERFDKALDSAERGVELYRSNWEMHFALAILYLRMGNYARGLKELEHRISRTQLDEYPEWQGKPLEGKTILVCREWGLGDNIMFARYRRSWSSAART